MSQVMEIDAELVADKQAFRDSVARFLHVLSNTPDDRLNWTPSETARTPLQVAAHVAMALESIRNMAQGDPFGVEEVSVADRGFRDWELQFTERSQVLDLIEERTKKFIDAMDGFTPTELDKPMTLPFKLGAAPKRMAYKFATMHNNSHTPQIEYIQTCYGDHNWHMRM